MSDDKEAKTQTEEKGALLEPIALPFGFWTIPEGDESDAAAGLYFGFPPGQYEELPDGFMTGPYSTLREAADDAAAFVVEACLGHACRLLDESDAEAAGEAETKAGVVLTGQAMAAFLADDTVWTHDDDYWDDLLVSIAGRETSELPEDLAASDPITVLSGTIYRADGSEEGLLSALRRWLSKTPQDVSVLVTLPADALEVFLEQTRTHHPSARIVRT